MSFLSVPFCMQIPDGPLIPPVPHGSIAYDMHYKSANLPAGKCIFSSSPRNVSKMIGSEVEDMNLLGAYLHTLHAHDHSDVLGNGNDSIEELAYLSR